MRRRRRAGGRGRGLLRARGRASGEADIVATPTDDGVALDLRVGGSAPVRTPIGEDVEVAGLRAVVAIAPSVLRRASSSSRTSRFTMGPMMPFDPRPATRFEL